MALDDIVNSAKKEIGISQFGRQFAEGKAHNVVSYIAGNIEGGRQALIDRGIDPDRAGARKPPAWHADFLNRATQLYQTDLYNKVNNEYQSVINSHLGQGVEGLRAITGILSQTKPKDYQDVNQAIYKAHKDAYDAMQDIQDPENTYAMIVNELQEVDPLLGLMADRLGDGDAEFRQAIVQQRAMRAQEQLKEKIGGVTSAREYLRGQYENLDGNNQAELAIRMGRTVYAQHNN